MPRPGSHKYDIKRSRIRNALDDAGFPDDQADKLVREVMRNPRGATARLLPVVKKYLAVGKRTRG